MGSSTDLQIWNNAAFDNGEISDLTDFGNSKASFDSDSGKENSNNSFNHQVSSISSSVNSSTFTPFKPINSNSTNWGIKEKSRVKCGGLSVKGIRETLDLNVEDTKGEIRDEKRIDKEIEEIESEILRLSLRLEVLRVEKIEKSGKFVEKRGSSVPAKFMDQKPVGDISSRTRVQKRGSIGPAEINSVGRRGMSIGPCEIFGGSKLRQLEKQEMITPSRRKSCFWKLEEIDEDNVVGKSSSVSPKSRKVAAKSQVLPRQAVTTIASKKTAKRGDAMINTVQPKKLFKEGEKSVADKKPLRTGRVVASRYNQNPSQVSAMRKRSLPENDKDDGKGCDKKRSLCVGKSRVNPSAEIRVKKKWEIPSEVAVHGSVEAIKSSPKSVVAVPDWLPRVRIDRCTQDSPRDSGPAKKVADLIGKKSFFTSSDEEVEPSICQALTYESV